MNQQQQGSDQQGQRNQQQPLYDISQGGHYGKHYAIVFWICAYAYIRWSNTQSRIAFKSWNQLLTNRFFRRKCSSKLNHSISPRSRRDGTSACCQKTMNAQPHPWWSIQLSSAQTQPMKCKSRRRKSAVYFWFELDVVINNWFYVSLAFSARLCASYWTLLRPLAKRMS